MTGNPPRERSIASDLVALFRQLSPARRRSLLPLIALMLVGAVAELVTIGALLPLLAALAGSESSAATGQLARMVGSADPGKAVYVVTGLFALAAIAAAALRLLLIRRSQTFVQGVAYELGVRLYAGTLAEPYASHIAQNSSTTLAAIDKVQHVTGNVLVPVVQALTATIIASFIIVGLIAIDPVVALVAGGSFALIYLVTTVFVRERLRRDSVIVAREQDSRVKAMQEGLGGIRDVLIDQSQGVFVEAYERAEGRFRDAIARTAFLANMPRFIVEGLGMVLIAAIAVVLTRRPGGLEAAIPVLGALALGAQRLMPLLQLIYAGWAQPTGSRAVLSEVVALLERPLREPPEAGPSLPFEHSLRLDRVSFTYGNGRQAALREVSLVIPKGARVGIAGKTGGGKSTLMDVVIGLLEPSSGAVLVDGVALTPGNRPAWQRNIAHVPQAIYLADASIAENIAFGVRAADIDRERVRRAAEQAELGPVVAALPQGYDTRIGERGIQLSGGQRQRLGIARALYKQARLLVFDEATSALDTETERAVMHAIDGLDRDLTVLVIAHRLSTLENCDTIVRLEDGRATVESNVPRTVRRAG